MPFAARGSILMWPESFEHSALLNASLVEFFTLSYSTQFSFLRYFGSNTIMEHQLQKLWVILIEQHLWLIRKQFLKISKAHSHVSRLTSRECDYKYWIYISSMKDNSSLTLQSGSSPQGYKYFMKHENKAVCVMWSLLSKACLLFSAFVHLQEAIAIISPQVYILLIRIAYNNVYIRPEGEPCSIS